MVVEWFGLPRSELPLRRSIHDAGFVGDFKPIDGEPSASLVRWALFLLGCMSRFTLWQ